MSCLYLFFFLDISIAVIDLLQELTDPDILNENEDTASVLIDALVCINSHWHYVCMQNVYLPVNFCTII